jgi:hypothetical protein
MPYLGFKYDAGAQLLTLAPLKVEDAGTFDLKVHITSDIYLTVTESFTVTA